MTTPQNQSQPAGSDHPKSVIDLVFQFEEELQRGALPSIEAYLEKVDAYQKPDLLSGLVSALLENDGRDRLRQDEYEDYLNRFGEIAKVLEEYLQPGAAFQPAESSGRFAWDKDQDAGKEKHSNKPEMVSEPPRFNEPSPFGDLEYVGKGGYGRVYRTALKGNTRTVALKIANAISDEDRYSKVELELLTRLQQSGHPGIVQCINGFEGLKTSDGRQVIVEEWIDGGTLRDYFEKAGKKVDYAESLRIIREIVEALACIHQAGIFHLDLRMSNVMMREPFNQPTIVDFGGGVKRDNRDGAEVGSLPYLAPERLYRPYWDFQITARTDIFSVGVIFYQLLTGDFPFRASSREELLESFLHRSNPDAPRSLVTGISESINRICLKCLKINPFDRFTSAQDLLDALSIVDEVAVARSPQQTVEQRVLKLLPMELPDQPFYESLMAVAGQVSPLNNADSLIQQLQSRTDGTPQIIALSAPSGAGKSSWVKAFLLPRLLRDAEISICRLEASEHDNSSDEHTFRLLEHELCVHLSIPQNDTAEQISATKILHEVVAGKQLPATVKLLIVIDQFEQWLLRFGRNQTSQLLTALQQCNGSRLQTLLIFRSDYENLIKPMMRHCGLAFHDGQNSFELPILTSPATAAGILMHLLRTSGRLAKSSQAHALPAAEQHAARLLQTIPGHEILSVQIVLLARYCLRHAHNPGLLAEATEFSDIVRRHVSELFEELANITAQHQMLLDIIRRLLPDGNAQSRPAVSLCDLTPTQNAPDVAFKITQDYLRSTGLIMEAPEQTFAAHPPKVTRWQLTHEFWISPLRAWLDAQPETEREKLLRSLSDRWHNDPRSANLPTLNEYLLVRRIRCKNARETALLAACRRHFALSLIAAAMLLLAGSAMVFAIQVRDFQNTIKSSPPGALLDLPGIQGMFRWFVNIPPIVTSKLNTLESHERDSRIPCHIMLLKYQSIDDPRNDASIQFLLDNLPHVTPKYQYHLIEQFRSHQKQVLPRLTGTIRSQKSTVNKSEEHSRLAHLTIVSLLLDRLEDAQDALGSPFDDQSAFSEFTYKLNEWTAAVEWSPDNSYDKLKSHPELLLAVLQAFDIESLFKKDEVRNLVQLSLSHPKARIAFTASYMWNKLPKESSRTSTAEQTPPIPMPSSDWRIDTHAGLILVDTGIVATSGKHLWASDTEITWGHIRKLCPDLLPEHLQKDTDHDNSPATALDASLIFGFINRLNQKYSLPETYRKVDLNGEDKWEPVPDARGFRLPFLSEFRMLASAMAPDYRSLGNKTAKEIYWRLLQKYANVKSFPISRTGFLPVRSLCPNRLGLSDILGNASEIVICDDNNILEKVQSSSPDSPVGQLLFCMVGGDYSNEDSATFLGRSFSFSFHKLNDDLYGFRVVCDDLTGPSQ